MGVAKNLISLRKNNRVLLRVLFSLWFIFGGFCPVLCLKPLRHNTGARLRHNTGAMSVRSILGSIARSMRGQNLPEENLPHSSRSTHAPSLEKENAGDAI